MLSFHLPTLCRFLHAVAIGALTLATAHAQDQAATSSTLTGYNLYASHDKVSLEPVTLEDIAPFETEKAKINIDSRVAIARLDQGRFITTPYDEQVDWGFLDMRLKTKFNQLGLSQYLKYTPALPINAPASENIIDEIRLTAANENFDYVLIYGLEHDARWASFGGKALPETGLTIADDCISWEAARSKALLIKPETGDVLGAVTADNIDYNIGELADRVEIMIRTLSDVSSQTYSL